MSPNIFMIGRDRALTELNRSPYDSEELLQALIADHPTILGAATGSDGGLLLVRREYAVPDAQDGYGRWSLDHLFLDRNGVPILIEVKRATDTRARREVVAQMLDYAANGIAYWPIDGLVEAFRQGAEAEGVSPDARLAEYLGETEPEAFWRAVESNLRSGRVRMVFLADEIGKELRRIVEFLNEQMRPAEVLAVEVVQYVGPDGVRTLVPSLVGATERARTAKSVVVTKEAVDEPTWLASIEEGKGRPAREGAEKAIAWMRARGIAVSMTDTQESMRTRPYPFFVWRSGTLDVCLEMLKSTAPYSDAAPRLEIAQRMKELPGSKMSKINPNGWPSVSLAALLRPDVWDPLEQLLSEIHRNLSRGTTT